MGLATSTYNLVIVILDYLVFFGNVVNKLKQSILVVVLCGNAVNKLKRTI